MAGFVNGHALGRRHVRRDPPPVPAVNSVGYPCRRAALKRGIDDGDVAAGYAPYHSPWYAGRARRFEMALRLIEMPAAAEPHLDRRQRLVLEARGALDVVGLVVHTKSYVLLMIPMRRRAIRAVAPIALDARRADRPALRHCQRHVVDAVVGEELGARVKLVAVPPVVLQDAELREPLRDEEEVPDGARPRERPRDVRRPFHLDVVTPRPVRSAAAAAPPSPSHRRCCRRPARWRAAAP